MYLTLIQFIIFQPRGHKNLLQSLQLQSNGSSSDSASPSYSSDLITRRDASLLTYFWAPFDVQHRGDMTRQPRTTWMDEGW